MMNPAKLMKLKTKWDDFSDAHPRFVEFLKAAGDGYVEAGTVVDISLRTEDGRTIHSNLRLSQEDVDSIRELRETFGA